MVTLSARRRLQTRSLYRIVEDARISSRLFLAVICLAFLGPLVCMATCSAQEQARPENITPPGWRTPPQPIPQSPLPRLSGTLRIAAAADLQPILPALAAEFQKATGVHVVTSFASSSTLATQIINGGPFDLFLAADFTFPELVVARGFADSRQPTPYANGSLALWARKDSPLQPISMNTLSNPALKSLAIADQTHAPYGRAAYAALTRLKLISALGPRLVIAENIAQTAQFAESGNAQAALISLTLAKSDHFRNLGSFVLVPKYLYPSIRQCAVVMKDSPNRTAAHAFLTFLVSDSVQKQLADKGLDPPK